MPEILTDAYLLFTFVFKQALNYGYSCKNLPISASFYRVRLNFDKSFADKQTLFGLYMAFLPQL